jgi:hypothetical protein
MYEFEVRYSETKKEGTRISWDSWIATVCAEDENEVRKIMAEDEPGKAIDKITRGKWIDDDTDAESAKLNDE